MLWHCKQGQNHPRVTQWGRLTIDPWFLTLTQQAARDQAFPPRRGTRGGPPADSFIGKQLQSIIARGKKTVLCRKLELGTHTFHHTLSDVAAPSSTHAAQHDQQCQGCCRFPFTDRANKQRQCCPSTVAKQRHCAELAACLGSYTMYLGLAQPTARLGHLCWRPPTRATCDPYPYGVTVSNLRAKQTALASQEGVLPHVDTCRWQRLTLALSEPCSQDALEPSRRRHLPPEVGQVENLLHPLSSLATKQP